ncbi:hypothetical protein P7L75_19310 [Tistrella mobilis]|uniref:hypothetical protein n=1 Tax=Tistrella mobilis TaxID=171437 RepID=UPI0035562B28
MDAVQRQATAGTYENPKVWGNDAQKGDIFVVRPSDADNNHIYAAGDFMIAQFDGSSQGRYYPAWGENNADWQHAWSGLSDFRIVFETGATSGSIYGNGLNQIGVRIYFTPIDVNSTVVPLSPAVLARTSITLLDYTTAQSLPSGWAYGTSVNQFHTLPEGQNAAARFAQFVQEVTTYYVTCATDARSRAITIGSKITLPDGGYALNADQHFSAPAGNFKNSVALRALTPIFYNSSNTRLDREDTANGKDWDQDNYYFTITEQGCYIIRSDISGAPSGPSNWSIISKDKHPNWHYIWQFGPENTAYISQIGINIRYNQRRNAVCLTRLHSSSYNSGYDNWYYETRFTIYDQYGNSGLFSAVRNESDWGNTIWVAEGNHTSKG